MKQSFSPNAAGVGATHAWDGNDKVGPAAWRSLPSTPARWRSSSVLLRPIEGHNTTEHLLKPTGAGTGSDLGHLRPDALPVEGDERLRPHGIG